MKIIISGKKLELTEGIKTAIEDKLGKLERYLNPETEVKVTVSAKKAEDSEENLYAAIDVVYDKLKKQIRRYKNKLQDRHQSKDESIRFQMDGGIEEDDENLDIVIERRKKFDMKPMSPEEAVLQMELIEHGFYMFRNIDSDEISIVYKREDGGYGLIEHE